MIRDSLAEDIQLMMLAAKNDNVETIDFLLKYIKKGVIATFKDTIPKKYFIFTQVPEFYFISKTFCIELPSWGSKHYRELVYQFGLKLREYCVTDISYFNGKTTFMIRGIRNDFDFKGGEDRVL